VKVYISGVVVRAGILGRPPMTAAARLGLLSSPRNVAALFLVLTLLLTWSATADIGRARRHVQYTNLALVLGPGARIAASFNHDVCSTFTACRRTSS
jgi:hypothetical protein